MQVKLTNCIGVSTSISGNWDDILKSFAELSDGALYHKTLIGFMSDGPSIKRSQDY